MNVVKIINEVITEMLSYGEITLDEAKRYYGTLVTWDIDSDDLKIINRMRRQYFEKREEMYGKGLSKYDFETATSDLWNEHMRLTKEALWNNAQK